jgi:hypothetical protein
LVGPSRAGLFFLRRDTMGKAQIIHVKVDQMPELKTTDTYYKNLQTLVGGHMDAIFVAPNIAMYHHGEGKLIGLPFNFLLCKNTGRNEVVGDNIVGDVFFATHDSEGEMISLTEDMVHEIMNMFLRRDTFLMGH